MNRITSYLKQQRFIFKQWSRKPYAVFQSLQKIVAISCLAATYTLLWADISVAQTDSATIFSQQQELDEIIITARRTPVAFEEVSRLVSILDAETLSNMPAHSPADALEYLPGLDLRQRGVNGVQADLRMRGGSFDQNLILLNGINISDPQTGHHNLNLPVDMQSIDKIEILHGPAARVFGANAFSGAVNFITALENKNYVRAFFNAGQYNFWHTGVSVNMQADKSQHFGALSYKQAGDYTKDFKTDFQSANAFYHGKLKLDDYELALQAGRNSKDFAANTFYSPYYTNQYEETTSHFVAISGRKKGHWHLEHHAYWRQHLDHYLLKRQDPDFYQNYHQTNTAGGNINAWQTNTLGKTALGMHYRYEGLLSNNLGNEMNDKLAVPFASDAYYTKSDERHNLGAFAEQNISMGAFTLSIGLLVNWNSMYPQKLRWYPGLDASYAFNKKWRGYASVNRSLRMPTFTDMYYSGPTNIGNSGLKPEKAWTGEAGVKYITNGLQIKLAGFQRRGENIISWLWIQDMEKWHTQNITQLYTTGAETGIHLKPQATRPGQTFIKRLSITYSYIDINKQNKDIITNYTLDNLKHKFSVALKHKVLSKLTMRWHVGYFNRNGAYLMYDTGADKSYEKPYAPHWKTDVRLSWQNASWKAYLEATNLLDETYHETGNVPQPGRWIKGGFSYKMEW